MSKEIYEIMNQERKVARIDEMGRCKIYYKSFMPYNLYLEEEEDIDSLVNNIQLLVRDKGFDVRQEVCKGNFKQHRDASSRHRPRTGKNCIVIPLRITDRCVLGKEKGGVRHF